MGRVSMNTHSNGTLRVRGDRIVGRLRKPPSLINLFVLILVLALLLFWLIGMRPYKDTSVQVTSGTE